MHGETIAAAAGGSLLTRLADRVADVLDPIFEWLLKPFKDMVNWFHNRYLADKSIAPRPLHMPVREVPADGLVLYVAGI